MNADIKEMIAAYKMCRKYEVSQVFDAGVETPSRPWEKKITIDLFTFWQQGHPNQIQLFQQLLGDRQTWQHSSSVRGS